MIRVSITLANIIATQLTADRAMPLPDPGHSITLRTGAKLTRQGADFFVYGYHYDGTDVSRIIAAARETERRFVLGLPYRWTP